MTKKKKWLIGSAGILIVILSAAVFIISQMTSGSEEGKLDPEASASYNMQIELDEGDLFRISAEIDVENRSKDDWETVGFYFIPNAINEEETPGLMQDPAITSISSVSASGETLSYDLENNQLLIELQEELEPGEEKRLKIDYTLRLPKEGLRLSQDGASYFLAQWYPMLGFYQNGWTIEDFDLKGESYHTNYSKYKVSYDLPQEFFVASSADDGELQPSSSGTVEGERIKDFYIAFMDPEEWITRTRKANDTQLRMFFPVGSDIVEETAELAVDAYSFFEEKIGDNPFQELDIIANDGYMEYPNVIEVASDQENLENVLVHEIGHQWFYFLVANDPFEHAWLDESITEYVTSLFLADRFGSEDYGFGSAADMASYEGTNEYSNLPLDEYEEIEYVTTIYGKTPIILRDFFNEHGGEEEAFRFLAAYYEEYQFQNVDTETFIAFFNDHFKEDHSGFFEEWLK
ncbi:M1 family metallopeptidase [Planomicrobium soli]|nr:M1 family metallopeptidase [Planomicrobium soli]